jgi:hypothetical protein
MMVGSIGAVVWSPEQVTMTFSTHVGGTSMMHQFFESLEHVVKFSNPERVTPVSVDDSRMVDKWPGMQAAAQVDFADVSSDEWKGWPRII